MSQPPARPAVYADLLTVPEEVRAEILNGRIVASPVPLERDLRPQRALSQLIGGPFDDDARRGGPGGWWIFVETDVQLGPHDIVRPELAGFRRTRLSGPSDQRPLTVVPDWVCEVLSPSTAHVDRVTKRALYAARGVTHYWIVDVDARVLEAFVLHDGQWMLAGTYGEEACARVSPFDAVELDVGRLFLTDME